MAHKAEIEVMVKRHATEAMLVTDGEVEGWVPYSLIDPESEIDEETKPGTEGLLVIPQWKAEELEFV